MKKYHKKGYRFFPNVDTVHPLSPSIPIPTSLSSFPSAMQNSTPINLGHAENSSIEEHSEIAAASRLTNFDVMAGIVDFVPGTSNESNRVMPQADQNLLNPQNAN